MVTLTKAEERIMKILWEIGEGFIKDIIEGFPNPKHLTIPCQQL